MSVEVRDVPERDRYEIVRDGTTVGFTEYQRAVDLVVLSRTEIDPALKGQGLGGRLVQGALDHVRGLGLSVLPVCPFVQAWMAKHPDYADLDYRRRSVATESTSDTAPTLTSPRLTMRAWTLEDTDDAFAIFGDPEVARWLSPAMDVVPSKDAMRPLLQQWGAEQARATRPNLRWAVEVTGDDRVIGGITLLPLPPRNVDLELGWMLARDAWGNGYASEAAHTVAHWAFEQPGVQELFAVVRDANTRGAATAERIGMEWVGETDKYYDLHLQVYRVRAADLDQPLPGQPRPPHARRS